MNTMSPPVAPTWPAPTTIPPPPPTPKKSHKGLIILAVLIGLGVIGAIGNASDNAKNKATFNRGASNSLVDNTTSAGLNETGYVRDACANTLDMDLAGINETFRQALASGDVTIAALTDSFAHGYYDKDGGASSDLSRAEVVAACGAGLRNG